MIVKTILLIFGQDFRVNLASNQRLAFRTTKKFLYLKIGAKNLNSWKREQHLTTHTARWWIKSEDTISCLKISLAKSIFHITFGLLKSNKEGACKHPLKNRGEEDQLNLSTTWAPSTGSSKPTGNLQHGPPSITLAIGK